MAIITKPDRKAETDKVTHLVGRDFGMVNTISLSVVKIDDPIDPKKLQRIADFTKEETLKYLKSYSHPNINIVDRVQFNGRKFLDNINAYCERIDRLKSQIDSGYNCLNKLKSIICGYIGTDEKEQFTEGQLLDDPHIQNIYNKFFRLLKHIVRMKRLHLSCIRRSPLSNEPGSGSCRIRNPFLPHDTMQQ